MLNTYSKMIPLYMKEDTQFSQVYKFIEDIFNQIIQTCEDMKTDLKFSIDSAEFLEVLNLFGSNTFIKKSTDPTDPSKLLLKTIGLLYNSTTAEWTQIREQVTDINISLSKLSLYFSAKFNTLKNNFDGTFKTLYEDLTKVFNTTSDTPSITDYLNMECSQGITQDEVDYKDHPVISLYMILDSNLTKEFPPYTEDDPSDPSYNPSDPKGAYEKDHIGDINYILQDWLNLSPENVNKYNTYKNFLELLTLFDNEFFNLDILGVLTKFELSKNAKVLKWGHSKWNQTLWSDSSISVEEE